MTPARQIAPATPVRRRLAAGMAVLAGLFALVYARSLTFVYIEGDDATSIAYHALGRVREVQPPYSAYQCMMDAMLGVLPAEEHVLRVSAMLITALAAPVLMALIILLAFEWAGSHLRISWLAAALVVPLAAPELIYLGLVYTPALVGLSAAIASHLMIRRASRTHAGLSIVRTPLFWASVLLFGAGVACRWDILAYGLIVSADLWLGPGLSSPDAPAPRSARFTTAVVWGVAALSAWFVAIALNGFGPAIVLKTLRTAGPVESYPSLFVAAATMQTLATPALVLLAALGFFVLAKRRDPLCILALLGVALTLRYIPLGVPKWFLVAVPGLVACMLVGFSTVWQYRGSGAALLRVAAVACLAAPWLIGVQATFGDSAYGPGFQVLPFDRPLHTRSFVRPVLGAGALVPTSEGPRPVGGHAWVLFGGAWRTTVRESDGDLARSAAEASARGLPLLQDFGQGLVVAALAGMGYTTHDSWKREERTFVSRDGRPPVRVFRLPDREALFTPSGVDNLARLAGTDRFVAFAYTSTLRRLYKRAPGSLEKLGATVAVLDLGKLRETADKMADSTRQGRLP